MNFPEELKYTKDHEWIKLSDAEALVGISEFAQSELGEVVFVDLPPIGKQVVKGQVLCVVESTKAASDVYAPISGTVMSHNSALSDNPSAINADSYGNGWLCVIQPSAPEEAAELMTSEQYKKLINK